MPEGTIRMWESGRTEPRMGMVEKISSLFNVSKGYLLGEIEEIVLPEFDSEIEVPYFGVSWKVPPFLMVVNLKECIALKNKRR